jgi:magnesium chelatase subunit D
MGTVKAAVLSLLLDAYQRRDKVGMITFRGAGAELALPPTSSVDVAAARLTVLPTGGRTPLADGLLLAHRTLVRERLRDPSRRPLLVVVTDGRHTAGGAPAPAAALLARTGVAAVVVDCEAGRIRLGLAAELAGRLGALVLPLEDLGGAGLGPAVRGGAGAAAVPRGPDRPGGGSGGGSGSGGGGGGGGAGGGGGPGGGLAATVRALRDAA